MKHSIWITGMTLAVLLVASQALTGNERKKEGLTFGALEPASAETVRAQAQAWLKEVGKTDAATTQQFEAIWKQEDRPVLDRLADTFAMANTTAAELLAKARDPLAPAPTKVPEIFSDAKASQFFRANLALAFARSLSNRRVHDEALQSLVKFRPEQVVDPAAYLFHRAVCEHALLLKTEATKTIGRLLDDAQGAPERYRTVSALMQLDMITWKEKDLGAVARKMRVVEDRLDLARGGPETQTRQKEILARLDELIKELENKAKKGGGGGGGPPNDGGCPDGGGQQPGSQPGNNAGNNPSAPMQDSNLGGQGGKGTVDPVKMKKMMDGWGKMAPREQAKAVQELTRGLSPRHREAIENYFRNLAQVQRK